FAFAREKNAAYAEAGRYDAKQAAVFESQIAEAGSSVELAQIIGGMNLASQVCAADRIYVAPVVEEVPEALVEPEPVIEAPAEVPEVVEESVVEAPAEVPEIIEEPTVEVAAEAPATVEVPEPVTEVPETVEAPVAEEPAEEMPLSIVQGAPEEIKADVPEVETSIQHDIAFRFGSPVAASPVRRPGVRFVFGRL
ncbi:MAG: hypothetical protein J6O90_01790, partial [Candidatus Methanomethylophilaceae archaeon]|nr:hypothetical protein [Candidatus Methanomethylophilaceae archaeon]